jgi:hypothetical protein
VLYCRSCSNNLNAQDPRSVIKIDVTTNLGGQYLPCTGDYLWGDVSGELMIMWNIYKVQFKKVVVIGTDAYGVPTGNVYELSQNWISMIGNDLENTATLKLNGQVVAVFHMSYHTTTNANGEIVVDKSELWFNCK